jgi:hypothetical protein
MFFPNDSIALGYKYIKHDPARPSIAPVENAPVSFLWPGYKGWQGYISTEHNNGSVALG